MVNGIWFNLICSIKSYSFSAWLANENQAKNICQTKGNIFQLTTKSTTTLEGGELEKGKGKRVINPKW